MGGGERAGNNIRSQPAAASRRLPNELKARRPEISWRQIASIGNILRHEYERVAYDVLWRIVIDDLPALNTACREEMVTIDPHH